MTVSQHIFHAALRDPAQPVPDGLTDAKGNPAGQRFNVYRNNVALSLIEALQASFPVLADLLGAEQFTPLARAFMARHRPDTPVLHQYGARLPVFLETYPPLLDQPYLPDLARVEQALRESYHAADAAPVDPQKLTNLPPEALGQAVLKLAPSVQLLRSDWPIFDLMHGTKGRGPQSVLIARAEFDPTPHLLTETQADFIGPLLAGQTLGAAFESVPEGFDLTPVLQLLLAQNALTDISIQG